MDIWILIHLKRTKPEALLNFASALLRNETFFFAFFPPLARRLHFQRGKTQCTSVIVRPNDRGVPVCLLSTVRLRNYQNHFFLNKDFPVSPYPLNHSSIYPNLPALYIYLRPGRRHISYHGNHPRSHSRKISNSLLTTPLPTPNSTGFILKRQQHQHQGVSAKPGTGKDAHDDPEQISMRCDVNVYSGKSLGSFRLQNYRGIEGSQQT